MNIVVHVIVVVWQNVFLVGMKKSLILSDEEREARNKLVETNRLKRGKELKRQCMKWVCIIYIIENFQITFLSEKRENEKMLKERLSTNNVSAIIRRC
jgi:hypothetical protein